MKPAWRFGKDKHVLLRPAGTRITVVYSQNTITYRYDRRSNTYLRSVSGEKRQIDRGVDKPVAPKNVIVMSMSFGRLNDGSRKNRLEAQFIGRGTAWISTNGITVKGTWRKRSMTDPTRFYGKDGKLVAADDRADLHPGDAEGVEDHDQGRQGAEVHPDVPPAAQRDLTA